MTTRSVIGLGSSEMLFMRLKMCLMSLNTMLYGGKFKVVKGGSITKQVHSFCSTSNPLAFRFKMGHKMKKLKEGLDKIAADKSRFNLSQRVAVVDSTHVLNRNRVMTHSYVETSSIIGRDQDKENIVSILMQSSSDEENVSVIPIIGIGGLGKTALAKLVYNDERVVQHFNKRMWVCVSDHNFDIENLIKRILISATKGNTAQLQNDRFQLGDLSTDELQTHLRNALHDNRYLLVLDDVWNSDREKWLELKELLMGSAGGSKIVVTTRKNSVASIMGTFPTQELKGLSHEDCLSLFVKCAFTDGQGKHYPNLVKIGGEIVQKCGGVPLAVRALGGFLFGKVDERVWESVRDNEIRKWKEDRILPALKLSYDELPSYLKQCFAFCSVFPKDFEFNSMELIQFWLAHGLIQASSQNQDLEDIGNEYIDELCSRSFFQEVEDYKICFFFKMHDLVHDLALSVAQFEHHTGDNIEKFDSNEVQNVSFIDNDPKEVLTLLQKMTKIRTILFPYENVGATGESFVSTCASRFKYMRYLDLSESDFEALPNSIGNMKHLRYLSLHGNKRIKKLPVSICKLYQLQTLILSGCWELEELPRDMGNLISLRFLSITTKQRALPGEENGLGRLISLRSLWIEACNNLEFMFEGMQNLTTLRKLMIVGCPSLVSLPPIVRHLPALETLVIGECERLKLEDGDGDGDGTDNILVSSSKLHYLVIAHLPQLEALPQWLIQGPMANSLHYLGINGCYNFKALPESLENLTSLQELDIEGCPQLSTLPEAMHCLTALKALVIGNCPELSKRCNPETGEDWHKIALIPHVELDGEVIKSTTNN